MLNHFLSFSLAHPPSPFYVCLRQIVSYHKNWSVRRKFFSLKLTTHFPAYLFPHQRRGKKQRQPEKKSSVVGCLDQISFQYCQVFPPSSLSSQGPFYLISDAHFSLLLALKRKISLSNFSSSFYFLSSTGFSSFLSSSFFRVAFKRTSNVKKEKKKKNLTTVGNFTKIKTFPPPTAILSLQKCQKTTIKASRNERNSIELIEWSWCEQRHHKGVVCGHFYDVIS